VRNAIVPMLTITEHVSLAPLTTLGVGGVARYLIIVTDLSDIATAVQFALERALPYVVLGGGSNMLVSDTGYDGVVIAMRVMGRQVTEAQFGRLVTVAAGEMLDDVIAWTVASGWWGLENLSHIPGTVGATPVQNVGAYGVEVADCIQSVTVYDTTTGTTYDMSVSDCMFGYRDSIFKQQPGRYIIASVTFRLSTVRTPHISYKDLALLFEEVVDAVSIAEIREAVISIRSQKFPDWTVEGTAGSFFKNPIISATEANQLRQQYPDIPLYPTGDGQIKIPLGYVLDKICQLKGYAKNGVRLYEQQALVLVTEKNNSATAIENFSTEIKKIVKEKTGIEIEEEVTKIK
jgi:UDP-N-acetylmuramate dehydrogenase